MKTLRNLQQMVDTADPSAFGQTPTPKAIRESGAKVAEYVRTSDGSELAVYDNGYVVYSNGIRATVFPLHDIKGEYSYQSAVKETRLDMMISEDDLLSMPWYLGVLMVAEDRIVHSQENSKVCRNQILVGLIPWEAFMNEIPESDTLEIVILKETFRENMDLLSYALSSVTDSQREILLDYFFEDMNQYEIAKARNTSQQSVSKTFRRGIARMQKALGVDPKEDTEG